MLDTQKSSSVNQAHKTTPLLKAQDVARQLNMGLPTVYQYAHRGLIPCLKIGKSVRFRQESLDRYLAGLENETYANAA